MSQHNSKFRETLVARLTEALAREDTSAMTVRQLREFVARIVDEAASVAPPLEVEAATAMTKSDAPRSLLTAPPETDKPLPEHAPPPAEIAPIAGVLPGAGAVAEPEPAPALDAAAPALDAAAAAPAPEAAAPAPEAPAPASAPRPADEESDVRTVRIPIGAILLGVGALVIAIVLINAALNSAGQAGAPRVNAPLVGVNPANVPAAPAAAQPQPATAKNPTIASDGTVFQPARTFIGDPAGKVYEMDFGRVTVKDGAMTLLVGGVPGYDGVYDYVRLKSSDGREIKFEAEDGATTKGDDYAAEDRPEDGHWWLQPYGDFSGAKGLVIRKQEKVPLLTTVMSVPSGEYALYIGSFKGDPGNGPFALGVTAK
jgi:hypothetical protein